MNFQQIKFFLTLAQTLNFTEAARLNNVAQPTLTKSIKKLEEELDGRLFYRDGKNTRLTQLGFTLLSQFERIDRNQKKLMEAAESITSGEISVLKLGVVVTAAPESFTKFLDEYKELFPNLTVIFHTVTTETVSDLLLTGALDACFCAGHQEEHPKLDYTDLFEEELVVIFPPEHKFSELDEISISQLSDENYIDRVHCEFRDQIMSAFDAQGEMLSSSITTDRDDWAKDLVRQGCGVTIIPERSVRNSGLLSRPLNGIRFKRQVSSVTVFGGSVPLTVRELRKMAKNYEW